MICQTDSGRVLVLKQYRAILGTAPVPSRETSIPTRQGETFVLQAGLERNVKTLTLRCPPNGLHFMLGQTAHLLEFPLAWIDFKRGRARLWIAPAGASGDDLHSRGVTT